MAGQIRVNVFFTWKSGENESDTHYETVETGSSSNDATVGSL